MGTAIGCSGFSYDDWKGVFYPADLAREDYLRFYSMFFPFVELDFSYYRMPESWRLEQLADTVPKDFLFTIKAHRSLTHESQAGWPALAAEFAAAVSAPSFRRRLAGVLLQFPRRFEYTDPNRLYLGELTRELSAFPLLLEFRNGGWLNAAVAAEAERRGIGLVAVDAPDLPGPSAAELPAVSGRSCLRLHGRNAEGWWGPDQAARYDYSYTDAELRGWAAGIARAERKASSVLVAFNNHPRGNAVLDARRLKALLDAERPRLEALPEAPRQGEGPAGPPS